MDGKGEYTGFFMTDIPTFSRICFSENPDGASATTQFEGRSDFSSEAMEVDCRAGLDRWGSLLATAEPRRLQATFHDLFIPQTFDADHRTTLHHTTAEVRSQFGGSWGKLIRDRIESYGANKLPGNTDRAREGMSLIMNLLRRREKGEGSDTPEPPSA